VGGNLDPDTIGIVGLDPKHPMYREGVDVPIEDWNQDLWDAARLSLALSDPIDPEKLIKTVNMGGSIDAIKVTRRRDLILSVNGRRRILAARTANRILVKRGENVDSLIALPVIVDRSTDLEISVRAANEGHLDEPPYIKAANAARLRVRGKDDEAIQAVFGVEMNTLQNWFAYAENLSPDIKARIEQGNKKDRIPFAVGVELAKHSGPGEHVKQVQALNYLCDSNAKLKGEIGRENAKAAIRAAMAGTLLSQGASVESEQGADESVDQSPDDSRTPPAPPSETRTRGGATGQRNPPGLVTATPKLSWPAIRQLAAHLEPSPSDPHKTEADQVAHGIFQVLTGADPTAEGLAKWPRIQEKFRKVVRSPAAPVPPAAAKIPDPTPPAAPSAGSGERTQKCPNVNCKNGQDQFKRGICATCEGYGKIKPAPEMGSCPAGCDRGVKNGKPCKTCDGSGRAPRGK
jgi:hypothetical protein